MSHTPTLEQDAVISAYATGEDLVVEAGAGTGKTSTLKMLAATTPRRRGVYIAYNRAIAADAAREFPSSVLCKTAHGLAYGSVGVRYAHRLRAPRLPAMETARILGIREPLRLADDRAPLAPQQLARIAMNTITNFCYSADPEPGRAHVPTVKGLDAPLVKATLAQAVVPLARKAWDDLQHIDGRLRFTHDCYLKLWALTDPTLPADYVLLDEAQDSNPAVAGIVTGQTHAQRILVGDRNQSIYGWRGATDAMSTFNGRRLLLSQSFRFGPAIADEANKWLTVLDAQLRLSGYDRIPSQVEPLAEPDAILCRSNARAISHVMSASNAGRRAALVGGGQEIERMAKAAQDLQAGRGTAHPELFAFTTWGQVQLYVAEDAAGGDLKVFVDLIDTYGPAGVIGIVRRLVEEDQADVVISTAHKAKGREWEQVLIADDFREPRPTEDKPNPQIPREDAMLAYVAVTRARHVLDPQGLAWVDDWLPGAPATQDQPASVPPPPAAARLSHCLRCGCEHCICSPNEAARWSALTGIPAGATS